MENRVKKRSLREPTFLLSQKDRYDFPFDKKKYVNSEHEFQFQTGIAIVTNCKSAPIVSYCQRPFVYQLSAFWFWPEFNMCPKVRDCKLN